MRKIVWDEEDSKKWESEHGRSIPIEEVERKLDEAYDELMRRKKKEQDWAARMIEKDIEEEERTSQAAGEKQKRVKTVFTLLEDEAGSIILQEIYGREERRLKFAAYDRGNGTIEIKTEHYDVKTGITYRPRNIFIDEYGEPVITLPPPPMEYESEQKLLEEVKNFITKYVELSPRDLKVVSWFVLHTWIYDCSSYAMQLFVVGDHGSGKTRLFETLRPLCYNTLALTGGSSLSACRRLQDTFRGTFMVNEFEPKSSEDSDEMILWLNAGFQKGLLVALSRKNNPDVQDFFNPFAPKLLTSRNMIENVATLSRLIVLKMKRNERKDIPAELPEEAYEEAEKLRAKLLMFRLKHYAKHYRLNHELDERLKTDETIDGRFKQLMLPMLVLAEIAQLDVEDVFKFYREESMEFKRRMAQTTIEGTLFNTMLELCNQETFEEPAFFGYIDENKKLVGMGSKILAAKTNYLERDVVKALKRIGMVPEHWRRNVLAWNPKENQPETQSRLLHTWVFPNEAAWREAYRRYFFQEPETLTAHINTDIPAVLKSRRYASSPPPG